MVWEYILHIINLTYPVKLQSLGFNSTEMTVLYDIVNRGGKVTVQALTSFGFSYEDARKLKYMYDICTGRVVIDSPDDLAKHLRKCLGILEVKYTRFITE